MAERIIKVSLALIVTDALTGKPLENGVRVRLNNGIAAQRKKDGFWVFLNLPAALYTIIVEAPFYQSKEIMVPVEQNFSLIEVGLFPGRQFPFAQTVEWLTGTVPSKKPVWAVLEQKPPRFQLTESFASGGKELALYDTGSAFSILHVWIDGGKNKRGLFWLSPQGKSDGVYQLDRPCPWPMDYRTGIFAVVQLDERLENYDIPLPASCSALHLVDRDGQLLVSRKRTGDE